MKGYRTIVFNVLGLLFGLLAMYGVDVSPEDQQSIGNGLVAILTVGNVILRSVTTTPLGSRE